MRISDWSSDVCSSDLLRRVAPGAQPLQLLQLSLAHPGVVDLQDLDVVGVVDPVLVDADDGLPAGVDARLGTGRRLLDAHLRDAGLDRLGPAPVALDLTNVRPRHHGEAPVPPAPAEGAHTRVPIP